MVVGHKPSGDCPAICAASYTGLEVCIALCTSAYTHRHMHRKPLHMKLNRSLCGEPCVHTSVSCPAFNTHASCTGLEVCISTFTLPLAHEVESACTLNVLFYLPSNFLKSVECLAVRQLNVALCAHVWGDRTLLPGTSCRTPPPPLALVVPTQRVERVCVCVCRVSCRVSCVVSCVVSVSVSVCVCVLCVVRVCRVCVCRVVCVSCVRSWQVVSADTSFSRGQTGPPADPPPTLGPVRGNQKRDGGNKEMAQPKRWRHQRDGGTREMAQPLSNLLHLFGPAKPAPPPSDRRWERGTATAQRDGRVSDDTER